MSANGWTPIMSPEHYRMVMNQVRWLAIRKLKAKSNWVLAMDMFCCGSTYAWETCRYAGIDPDGYTIGEVWCRSPLVSSRLGIASEVGE